MSNYATLHYGENGWLVLPFFKLIIIIIDSIIDYHQSLILFVQSYKLYIKAVKWYF